MSKNTIFKIWNHDDSKNVQFIGEKSEKLKKKAWHQIILYSENAEIEMPKTFSQQTSKTGRQKNTQKNFNKQKSHEKLRCVSSSCTCTIWENFDRHPVKTHRYRWKKNSSTKKSKEKQTCIHVHRTSRPAPAAAKSVGLIYNPHLQQRRNDLSSPKDMNFCCRVFGRPLRAYFSPAAPHSVHTQIFGLSLLFTFCHCVSSSFFLLLGVWARVCWGL